MTSQRLPLLFVDDQVVLPGMVLPVELDEARSAAVHEATSSADATIVVVPRLEGRESVFGVRAHVAQRGRTESGQPAAVLRGDTRVRLVQGTGGRSPEDVLWMDVETVEIPETDQRTAELADRYRALLVTYLERFNAWQFIEQLGRIEDHSELADTAGYAPWLTAADKWRLLETLDVADRLELLVDKLRSHIAEAEMTDKIASDVREGVDKTQREFLLRKQLDAIRKELGDTGESDADEYRSRVEAADLPESMKDQALREVGKLDRANDQGPEAGMIRTWLDTVLELPWNVRTDDTDDVVAAREVLDADHYGLEDVKDRIVEYLAVRARRAAKGAQRIDGRGNGAVLLFVGPPGVGKTSLGESVARALGRNFVRVALGGVRDEAEIRGHRRTYVGALPGRIVRAIGEAGSMNPVVLLDEVDKLGADYRGDPSSALLEVLDPAQNHTFRDHYLDADLDLSDVVFIATANLAEQVPQALLDRMEFVSIDGYTADDKVAIAREYLLPRQLERAALSDGELVLTDEALQALVDRYTREPGVRALERHLAKIARKVVTRLATSDEASVTVDEKALRDFVGRPRFTSEVEERTAVPGVATGLAVTGLGGDVLFVEASATDGEGLTLTGQLGDVMKESAQIALSFVRAHARELGIDDPSVFDKHVHIHVPAGAVAKDGPSAGVTMVTALTSLATGRKVRSEVGMTGEVTLNGRVMPIGGLKQKMLAAAQAGLTTVFVPKRNEPDLDDVPGEVLEQIDVRPMTDVAELVRQALEPAGADFDIKDFSAAS